MNQAQLERLLSLLEALPAASMPLDKERAAALGVSTDPEEAFSVAVEAIFVNEDYDAIEALVEVIADVTGTSPAPLLKAATEKPRQQEAEEDEEQEEDLEGLEDEQPKHKVHGAFARGGEGDRSNWVTVGQSYDAASAADKKEWWESRLKSARKKGQKWPRDVWGRELKSQEAYGKSLYRPGMNWPKKYGGRADKP
jgi:hypothetical protein